MFNADDFIVCLSSDFNCCLVHVDIKLNLLNGPNCKKNMAPFLSMGFNYLKSTGGIYGFRSFWSTADLPTVVSDRIGRVFIRSGATRAVALDISKAFGRVWHAGRLDKLKFYRISGQIFGLFSSFHSNRCLQVVLDGKSSG